MGFFESLVWVWIAHEVAPFGLAIIALVVFLWLFYRVLKERSKK